METIIKKGVLMVFLAFALCYTFALPSDDSPTWILDLIESKLIAIPFWVFFVILNKEWRVYVREE